MPRNGSGTASLAAPPAPFVNGQVANATDMMTVLNDITSMLTQSIAADGQTPITGAMNFGGQNVSNVGTLATTKNVTIADGGLTVTKGGATITAGGLTVSAGGAAITGNSAIAGTLGVTGIITAANATTGSQVINLSQIVATFAATGQLSIPTSTGVALVVKWGTGTYTAGAGTVTYGAAYPTATLWANAFLTTAGAAHGSFPPGVTTSTYATTGFSVYAGTGQNGTFNWIAVGH
jgi:hypothetical protein